MKSSSIEVIYSTRFWHFPTDQIRLSAMSNANFVSFMRDAFQFAVGGVASPEHPMSPSYSITPPGLSFEHGVGPTVFNRGSEDGEQPTIVGEIAVRSLGIDSNIVSIEAAGGSDHLDTLSRYLRYLVEDAMTPDGKPFLGTPDKHWDYSFVVCTLSKNKFRDLARNSLVSSVIAAFDWDSDADLDVQMSLSSEHAAFGERAWSLRPRFGTELSDRRLESRAWLPSDQHIAMLKSSLT